MGDPYSPKEGKGSTWALCKEPGAVTSFRSFLHLISLREVVEGASTPGLTFLASYSVVEEEEEEDKLAAKLAIVVEGLEQGGCSQVRQAASLYWLVARDYMVPYTNKEL